MRTCHALIVCLVCLFVPATAVTAQDGQPDVRDDAVTSQEDPPAANSDGAPEPPALALGTIAGLVLDQSGNVRRAAAVRARRQGRDPLITSSDASGRYQFAGVEPGSYIVDILDGQHQPSGQTVTVARGATVTHHIVIRARSSWISALVALIILLYASALLAFRHHNIVHTNRELLRAQLENIATRIPLESDAERRSESAALTARIADISKAVLHDLSWREWFFWSRGREIGAWTRLHEVERQLVAFLVPEARVIERAVTAEADLRRLSTSASAVALADRMRLTLQQVLSGTDGSAESAGAHVFEHLKQQLAEALTILYDKNDTKFAELMEWHNKAMWLSYLSLLVIAVVGLVFNHEELFLVGAAGGLMSRMARTLFREDVPNDYGASWTTLFLSPLLGAISAWFGIALIMWLTAMNVLGDAVFGRIDWNGGIDAIVIGTAFALGFSERLFTSLLSAVEGRVTTALSPSAAPMPPPVGAAVLPAAAGTVGGAAGEAQRLTTPTRSALIVRELDLQHGERAAFLGDPTSATRTQLVEMLGADHVFDVTADAIATATPLDAVLFESPPAIAELTTAATQLRDALRPDGRVVIIGRTPAALFDADAAAQRAQDHMGPALAKDVLITEAGLLAQEPPAPLNGADPVEWLAVFIKPAPGGSDR